jgi:hypothetical protein
MRVGKFKQNSQGEFIGFEYENGFVFNGEFDADRNPFYGDILNPDGNNIYNGQIGDIFAYFVEYIETGAIKQRPIL